MQFQVFEMKSFRWVWSLQVINFILGSSWLFLTELNQAFIEGYQSFLWHNIFAIILGNFRTSKMQNGINSILFQKVMFV